jgi:hypothetical protein
MTGAELTHLMRECAELLYQHCLNSEAAGLIKTKDQQNVERERVGPSQRNLNISRAKITKIIAPIGAPKMI